MDLTEERNALNARFATALTAAQGEESGFVLKLEGQNKAAWLPDAGVFYLRAYRRAVRSERLEMGPMGTDRIHRLMVLQIIVPQQRGDDVVLGVADAVKPAFAENGDGLDFDSAPELQDGAPDDGSHYTAAVVASYHFDQQRTSGS